MLTSAKQIRRESISEKIFRGSLLISALCLIIILFGIFITLLVSSMPSIKEIGLKFIYGTTWNPVENDFGGLPFLIGTLVTSLLALIIAIPFSISVGLFLGEYFKSGIVSSIFKNVVELLAAIASVIYGFAGIFILVPLVRDWEMKLGVAPLGVGILTSSIILSVMVVPFSVSLI